MSTHLSSLLKHRDITIQRLEKFIQPGQFSDVNLQSLLWKKIDSHEGKQAVTLHIFQVPDLKRIPFKEAIKNDFLPAKVGDTFGPSWSTYWAKVDITVPSSWESEPIVLLFDPAAEGLVWSYDGKPLQGITGAEGFDRHVDIPLTDYYQPKQSYQFYIEIGCNGMFGNGDYLIGPPDPNRKFILKKAELAIPNKDAHDLYWDFEILLGLIKELPADSQGAADALYTANQIVNAVRFDDPSSVQTGLIISKKFLQNHFREGSHDHRIIATGHCHIDTAWLWPYDETKRKVARSWSTQCTLMDQYSNFTFSCSQAAQFDWLEINYPSLFERVKEKVKKGQFIPIGGTWVEMDCNLPSGEGFCRQFLHGQTYFKEKFGEYCKVFWLPDTFGYSAQLPQILKSAGLKYFFTQKLSWNNINKFPHTTFYWTGLDGTSVLTHFSPADTYCAQVNVREVVFSVKNHKDKEYSNQSLLLFGNGDGGGGPLIPMIERLKRMQSISSLPASVEFGKPNQFFESLEINSRDLVEWRGELYFELHRGTYTSQAKTKMFNRKCEYLLRHVELLSSYAALLDPVGFMYPHAKLDELWRFVLLNQFHDVLPGSSIEMVYKDAERIYHEVVEAAEQLKINTWKAIASSTNVSKDDSKVTVFNPTGWPVSNKVIEVLPEQLPKNQPILQQNSTGLKALLLVDTCDPFSTKTVKMSHLFLNQTVSCKTIDGCIVVENTFYIIQFTSNGGISSLIDKENGHRQIVAPNDYINKFVMFEDIPLFWDAWDVEVYHLQKGWIAGNGRISVQENGPLRVVLTAEHQLSSTSNLKQNIILTAVDRLIEFDTFVDWNENRKILKVEFPVNINYDVATYETQYGFIRRPTHFNTSWDMARFEVCGHKFVDYSEHGYGVAVLNDCKYGHSVHKNVMRMSLLRAPKAPDANCDIGKHHFKYAIYPHQGTFDESDVVQRGYQFNVPLELLDRELEIASIEKPIVQVDQNNIVIDVIKKPEKPSTKTDVIVRLYECQGGRGKVTLKGFRPFSKVWKTNVLEEYLTEIPVVSNETVVIHYSPFELITLYVDYMN